MATRHPAVYGVDVRGSVETIEIIAFGVDMRTDVIVEDFCFVHCFLLVAVVFLVHTG